MTRQVLFLVGICGFGLMVACGGSSTPPPPQALTITSAAPPSGTMGVNYAGNGFVLTASGGRAPYSWSWTPASASALPPGLTLSNGTISGTPTQPSTYSVVITATDSQTPAAQTSIQYLITITGTVG